MKIAVPYDNGNVFPHFGRTEEFKVYEVEDGNVLNAEIVSTEGTGHEALAGFLNAKDISLVICGGMGAGAQAALSEAGIIAVTGAEGDADEAVSMFLSGELKSEGINCDHHEHGDEEGGCGSPCGGGCGHCGGGCGPRFVLEGKNVGKTVKAHYKGTFNDGTQFDSSYDRGEPLEFLCGAGMMIRGFDQAVAEMEVGEVRDIHLSPEEAYGPVDPNAIFTLEIADLPGSEELNAGEQAYLTNSYGQPVLVKVTDKTETTITFDANHEMAGKELNFRIELVEIN